MNNKEFIDEIRKCLIDSGHISNITEPSNIGFEFKLIDFGDRVFTLKRKVMPSLHWNSNNFTNVINLSWNTKSGEKLVFNLCGDKDSDEIQYWILKTILTKRKYNKVLRKASKKLKRRIQKCKKDKNVLLWEIEGEVMNMFGDRWRVVVYNEIHYFYINLDRDDGNSVTIYYKQKQKGTAKKVTDLEKLIEEL